MFGKKKSHPAIDKDQLELITTAQKRVKQKKRLYIHFVIFLIGAVFLILLNTVIGVGKNVTLFGKEWFVYAIFIWLALFIYHVFNVFITQKFLGAQWEQKQLDKLVAKQKSRIEELQKKVEITHPLPLNPNIEAEKKTQIIKGLTIIVAAGDNDAIGQNNQLIWHLSDDLKRFKQLTNGHHIIMGRKTFESFPKPLPNRTHIVITRQVNYKVPDGVIVVNNLDDALDVARNDKQAFIIGGGEIYKQAMPMAAKIELTRVHASFEADTFFPLINKTQWKETSNEFHPKDDNHDFSFSFITYTRH
ncbi:dihydrofolate reductase [Geojedonia litorea]|uniref:dihydrofolate reductase n=1 Tax=Geojedonia litorea TaxID=1268269 RepID=A0ABV9N3U5_9FLAO